LAAREIIAEPVAGTSVSDLALNETAVVFPPSAASDRSDDKWRIPVHVWVYRPQASRARKAAIAALLARTYGLGLTPETEPHFDKRINLLLADNIRGRRIVVEIGGQRFALPPTSAAGHARATVLLPRAAIAGAWDRVTLTAVTARDAGNAAGTSAHLLTPTGLSILSDIDDTVKVTHVTDRRKMWEATFYRPFAAVPGMADLYRRLTAENASASLHFVSSSPWHLYQPLADFLAAEKFPPATLDLKAIRLKDRTILNILQSGADTKRPVLENFLARFPGRRVLLVGDSGEQDPEIYAEMARRFPSRISRILIRNVTAARRDDARFAKVFASVDDGLWILFTDPAALPADLVR
jgi:phosphatidate phosphatase APP1